METTIESCDEHEVPALEAFLVERIYEFNAKATGICDAKLLAGRVRDEAGAVVAAFNGHAWAGCCVVAHLWVHESRRGRGLGSALLRAAETEARRRGCEQVVVSTHDFQAPAFYERMGYQRCGPFGDYPDDPFSVFMTRTL